MKLIDSWGLIPHCMPFHMFLPQKDQWDFQDNIWKFCSNPHYPIPSSAQGQAGWIWEQPGLVGRGVPMAGEWNQMGFKIPANPNRSVILCLSFN